MQSSDITLDLVKYTSIASYLAEQTAGQYDITQILLFLNRYDKAGYNVDDYTYEQLIQDAETYVTWISEYKLSNSIENLILFSTLNKLMRMSSTNTSDTSAGRRDASAGRSNITADESDIPIVTEHDIPPDGVLIRGNNIVFDASNDNMTAQGIITIIGKYKDTQFNSITIIADFAYEINNILNYISDNFRPPRIFIIKAFGSSMNSSSNVGYVEGRLSRWKNSGAIVIFNNNRTGEEITRFTL